MYQTVPCVVFRRHLPWVEYFILLEHNYTAMFHPSSAIKDCIPDFKFDLQKGTQCIMTDILFTETMC